MDNGKFENELEEKLDRNNFCEAFQIDSVKNEPRDNFTKCNNYWNSSSSETELVGHKHATDRYQEYEEEKPDVKNLNLKHFYSKFSEDSTSTAVLIKKDVVDIFYEDIKRETDEKKSSESIRLCKVCYESYDGEIDFFKPTSSRSECSCQKPKEAPFYSIHSEDLTLDIKPSSLDLCTDLGLQPLDVKEEISAGDEVAKEQGSSVLPENDNKLKRKLCSKPLVDNLSIRKETIQCNKCPKSFCHRGNFNVHQRGHTGEKPFHCKICSKTFTNSSHLRVHGRIHTGEKPFQCKICSKTFTSSSYLKVHGRVHTGEKPFQCKICSKTFTSSSHLKVHGRVHTGEKPFQCKICSKTFTNSSHLRVHRRIHTGQKPFHCKICFKPFTDSSHLRIHERIHTGEKSFHCKICSKSFNQMSNLKVHERIHTGEKPFHCQICPKAFSNSSLLKIHGRNHTGEKPYHCKICSKDFTTWSLLRIHGRIHTGEKFHCKICSKSFSQMGNLKVHERGQHS